MAASVVVYCNLEVHKSSALLAVPAEMRRAWTKLLARSCWMLEASLGQQTAEHAAVAAV